MQRKIVRREIEAGRASLFSNSHPLMQRIYGARRIHSADELEHGLERLLPYQALLNIEAAVTLLGEILSAQGTILIVGDFDADGATSTAVAMRALKSFGAKNVHYLVPNRFAFGYGLTPELVAVASNDFSPDLIITVDNGIANHAGVDVAKKRGMRVLITDHHLAGKTLPDADVIVNPNQPNDIFPSKNLAGVGVIFYVMLALRRHLLNQNWFALQKIPEPNMAHLLDLVALGTVADLVPLDHNNRILVHQGLRRIRASQCVPAIIGLLEFSNRNLERVVASDLGFIVASRLNAAGRLDDMSLGIECLLCDDSIIAREKARKLDQLNDERRHIEKEMHLHALDLLDNLYSHLQGRLPNGLCLFDSAWHQGVIGILASRIKDKFHRPVIVFAPGNDTDIKGSARSIAGFHIRDALAQIDVEHPDLIAKFGGHAMAAGLTIARHDFDRFHQAFNEVVSKQLNEATLAHILLSDGALETDDLNLDIAAMLRESGPWGQAFPEPLFDDVFHIVDQRIVGEKHLKLRLSKGERLIDAIAFFIDVNEWPNYHCKAVHAAYRLDINEYKGQRSVQLIIEHLEPQV